MQKKNPFIYMYATTNFILYEGRKYKQFKEISEFKDGLEIITLCN